MEFRLEIITFKLKEDIPFIKASEIGCIYFEIYGGSSNDIYCKNIRLTTIGDASWRRFNECKVSKIFISPRVVKLMHHNEYTSFEPVNSIENPKKKISLVPLF